MQVKAVWSCGTSGIMEAPSGEGRWVRTQEFGDKDRQASEPSLDVSTFRNRSYIVHDQIWEWGLFLHSSALSEVSGGLSSDSSVIEK